MASSAETKQQIAEITPAEARAELGNGSVVLVDTREPHEFAEAHLENAELVPPDEVLARIDELAPDPDQRVILYCRTGNRSGVAAAELGEQLGYSNVASVGGGIVEWQAQ